MPFEFPLRACDLLPISECVRNPDRLKIPGRCVTLSAGIVDGYVYYAAGIRKVDMAITEILKYVGRYIYYGA